MHDIFGAHTAHQQRPGSQHVIMSHVFLLNGLVGTIECMQPLLWYPVDLVTYLRVYGGLGGGGGKTVYTAGVISPKNNKTRLKMTIIAEISQNWLRD